LLILLVIPAYFLLFSGKEKRPDYVESTVSDSVTSSESLSVAKSSEVIANSVRLRLEKSNPPRNPIEAARNATVFIQTDWGAQGSGFIVDKNCTVVTNKHVVEFDSEQQLASILSSPDLRKQVVEEQYSLMQRLAELKTIYVERVNMEGQNAETDKLQKEILSLQDEVQALPGKYADEIEQDVNERAVDASFAEYKVSLFDGSEYIVYDMQFSDDHDLAFFQLSAKDCPFIAFGDPEDLVQGNSLYTVGNPSGLSYTVTSGVFSGYRTDGDNIFLQTDAPINPGNSGGPLITEDGKAVGVNTFVLREAQNIGFAIPVSVVKEEL
ncbi:MAG: trypsin-like peptidase domain-containing protein, partial [Arenicellales bacterium]